MSSELLTLFGGMTGNVVSAVGLVLMNKRVVVKDGFRFMTILTGFHFYFAFIACFLMLMSGHLQYKTVNDYFAVARIAVGMLSSVLFMNFNLATNSIGFYQVSKLMCIPVSLLVETLLDKRQQDLSVTLTFSLLLILIGVGLVCVKEVSFNSMGMLWAVLGVLSTSLAQVFFSPLQRNLGLNPLQLLFHVSPWLTFGSFLMTPLFDDIDALLDMPVGLNLCVDVLLSCCLAIFLNTTNYFVLSVTSPLTYQVLGHGKTICIFIMGILLYDDKVGLSHYITIPDDRYTQLFAFARSHPERQSRAL